MKKLILIATCFISAQAIAQEAQPQRGTEAQRETARPQPVTEQPAPAVRPSDARKYTRDSDPGGNKVRTQEVKQVPVPTQTVPVATPAAHTRDDQHAHKHPHDGDMKAAPAAKKDVTPQRVIHQPNQPVNNAPVIRDDGAVQPAHAPAADPLPTK
jgi:hypothetical protein